MQAEAIVQKVVQEMVDNADRAGLEVTKREDQLEFGKIEFPVEQHDSPWIHINHLKENKCLLWRDVIYNGLVRKLKKSLQFVPLGCQECYKVVVRPQGYEDMLRLEGVMAGKGWPSKIGIERRPFVPALYGAYFYNRGLESGVNRLGYVRAMLIDLEYVWLRDYGTLILPFKSYLKRGCTEMEMEQGPSDKWRVTALQPQIEELMTKLIYTPEQPDQTDDEKAEIRKKWAKFAWKYDPSYTGPSFQKDCVRY